MGAAAVGSQGVMQADTVLVASQRRLIDRAQTVILLVDTSKFQISSGAIVCELGEIDIIVTAGSVPEYVHDLVRKNGIELIVTDV
jgi:DeoR family ulaG and ulaABCDEF operon transcriptional repressor